MFVTDSKLFRILDGIGQCVLLSMLWLVLSLPVITAGSATAALYYTAVMCMRQDQGRPMQRFLSSFRQNFWQGTLAFLLQLAIGAAILGLCRAALVSQRMKEETIWLVFLVLHLLSICWMHYIFACIGRFHSSLRQILKNSLILCLWNLPRSLVMAVLLVAAVAGFILLLPRSLGAILFLPGLHALLCSCLLEPIFQKYVEQDRETNQN